MGRGGWYVVLGDWSESLLLHFLPYGGYLTAILTPLMEEDANK